jgi:drug/metabolite transporter (DMT)-like permease
MSHARAVFLMIVVTLLWSIAGVVARHLEAARSFEVTFWRSFFNALTLTLALSAMRGPTMWRQLPDWPRSVWISGICWAVMFTAFMVALTLTSVANVLITMALAPLVTALFARSFLHQHLPPRTWMAIAAAGLGIAWMFGNEARHGASPLGTLVALAVPLASAVNWTVLQHMSRRETTRRTDMLPAVWIGAVLSGWHCHWHCRCRLRHTTLDSWPCSVPSSWPCPACWSCACRANCRPPKSHCSHCSKSSSASRGHGSAPASVPHPRR